MRRILVVLLYIGCICFGITEVNAVNRNDWNLYFENINITEGSVKATKDPTIENLTTEITYSVNLNVPGDFYEFTVDATNGGTIDAMVAEISENSLTTEQKRYLSYTVTYSDGTKIKQYDRLDAGKTEKLIVRLEFKKDITEEDLPKEETTITLSLNTYYVQADINEADIENAGATDNNVNSNEEGTKDKTISNGIKNVKTGDKIITYVVIFVLALIALLFTKKKSDKENKLNK